MEFPPTVITPRAVVNRPGIVYDADKLSNFYVEDYLKATDHIEDIENYLNATPLSGLLKLDQSTPQTMINEAVALGFLKRVGKTLSYGLSLNGTSDYATITNNAAMNVDNITMSAWVYLTATPGSESGVIYRMEATSEISGYALSISSGLKPFCRIRAGGVTTSGTAPDALVLNRLYHIVAIYDGINIKLYVDNVLVKTQAHAVGGNIQNFNGNMTIGKRPTWNWYIPGMIHEIGVYNIAFTAAQIANLYNRGYGRYGLAQDANLALGVHFDNNLAVTITDYSANAIAVTLTGCTYKLMLYGNIATSKTIIAVGTTGNQTIDTVSGRVNIAAAGTTITITNSLVTANSIIMCTLATNDATAQINNVVAGAGSFVINIVACTAETAINFLVIN
jgi:hypothetical protein